MGQIPQGYPYPNIPAMPPVGFGNPQYGPPMPGFDRNGVPMHGSVPGQPAHPQFVPGLPPHQQFQGQPQQQFPGQGQPPPQQFQGQGQGQPPPQQFQQPPQQGQGQQFQQQNPPNKP